MNWEMFVIGYIALSGGDVLFMADLLFDIRT